MIPRGKETKRGKVSNSHSPTRRWSDCTDQLERRGLAGPLTVADEDTTSCRWESASAKLKLKTELIGLFATVVRLGFSTRSEFVSHV